MDTETRRIIDRDKASKLPGIIKNPELLASQRRITQLELDTTEAVKKYIEAGGDYRSASECMMKWGVGLAIGQVTVEDMHEMMQEMKILLNELPRRAAGLN